MRFNIGRFFISMLIIIGVQYATIFLCELVGINNVMIIRIVEDVVLAFVLTIFNYPRMVRKHCLKDPFFARNFLLLFLAFFAIDLLFNFRIFF